MVVANGKKRRTKRVTADGPETPVHLSGHLHVTGRSRFVDDEPRPAGLCFVKVLPSPHARARIVSINADEARAMPGVVAVLTAADIPGENQIGSKIRDEPLLPVAEVNYVGQPVAIVVGESAEIAAQARERIRVDYEELEPVLTVDRARELNYRIAGDLRIERGNVERALTRAEFTLEGEVQSGSQEHVYFETQRTRAIPGEDQEIILYSSTQSPTEVQEIVARVLALSEKDVTVDVKRVGGGFGGKESTATLWAALAALACARTRRPVELRLTRAEDMSWTGKRHPFHSRYRVGFNRSGQILCYDAEFDVDGGAFADLTMPIVQRSMLHADNAYFIPDVRIVAHPWRTNVPPNTAFRGFGAPQGIFAIECVIERIARRLRLDPLEVRRRNAYRDGQRTPYGQAVREATTPLLLNRLERIADYDTLKHEVAAFNRDHRYIKRGIGIVPVKFGVSFTASHLNQGSALVHVYVDGTVSLSHGGVEMGQEVNTKVAQVAAAELGVTIDLIRVESHNTKRTANTSSTAASTGSDINGAATRDAARQIMARLRPVAAALLSKRVEREVSAIDVVFNNNEVFASRLPTIRLPLPELLHHAWRKRIDLSAHGFHKTPRLKFDWTRGRGTPFAYYVFGAALVVAEVDVLSGYFALKRVFIVHETAKSLNPEIDRGQIEGGFMQGLGWCTFEEVVRDAKGRNLTGSLTTYKIPTMTELPESWVIEMVETERKFSAVRGSKAIGEPPFIYGEAVFFAIKNAIEAIADHRTEAHLRHPATPESILTAIERLQHP